MPRLARVVVPGLPHHITQRGNRRADVFFEPEDRTAYLSMLHHYAGRHGLHIWAYCLMTNHVHLVAVPRWAESMARTLRDAHQTYAVYLNRKMGESGHLWQGRFFSCVLDEVHEWAAVRYVEQNPVRAGMVERAEEYEWSSAAAHCGLRGEALLARDFPPPGEIADWSAWLAETSAAEVEAVRSRTRIGRPCGPVGFVERLEALTGRVLRPRKRGPKAQKRTSKELRRS